MDKIQLLDPCIDDRWDKFVERHPFGWIVHLSGWKVLVEQSFPHIKGYYLAITDSNGGDIQAALPLFEVRSWLTGNRLVSIPYATLSDPLISSTEQMQVLLGGAKELFKKLKTSYIEIRTFNSPSFMPTQQLGSTLSYTNHYIHLDQDLETIKKSFHRKSVRPRIRRAIDSKVVVRNATSELDMEIFFDLYKKSRKKLGLPAQPYLFFHHLWRIFAPSRQIELLIAEHKDKAIAGLVVLKFKERVSAEIMGTDEEYLSLSPNHLLFWEAIKSAHEDGYKIFDFGRTLRGNDSLMVFKSRWGTNILDLPQFCYPLQQTGILANATETSLKHRMVRIICRNSPEILYNHLSSFCYKHLG